MSPCQFYKCLADDTRLQCLLLISHEEEACVCELMSALKLDQPKISRHLALLRECQIVSGERRGKWVFYRLNPGLPEWARQVIKETAIAVPDYFQAALQRFKACRAALKHCC